MNANVMSEPNDTPREGGSYIRHPDGALERVAFTRPRESGNAPQAASAPAASPLAATPQQKVSAIEAELIDALKAEAGTPPAREEN